MIVADIHRGNALVAAIGSAVMRAQTGGPLSRETAHRHDPRPLDPVDLAVLMRRDHELTATQFYFRTRPGAYLANGNEVRDAAIRDAAMVDDRHSLPSIARTWLQLPDQGLDADQRWTASVAASAP